jgi:hypothetical protein
LYSTAVQKITLLFEKTLICFFNVHVCDVYQASEDGRVHALHADEYARDKKPSLRGNDYDADRHVYESEYAPFHDGDDDAHVFRT